MHLTPIGCPDPGEVFRMRSPLCHVTIPAKRSINPIPDLNRQGERKIVNPLENLSNKNLKHINKHLPEFQQYDANLTLDDIVKLCQEIAKRPENFIGTPGERQIFEQDVMLGEHPLRVRVVLNAIGSIRSVHIRKESE